jgi:hypothetical protein
MLLLRELAGLCPLTRNVPSEFRFGATRLLWWPDVGGCMLMHMHTISTLFPTTGTSKHVPSKLRDFWLGEFMVGQDLLTCN